LPGGSVFADGGAEHFAKKDMGRRADMELRMMATRGRDKCVHPLIEAAPTETAAALSGAAAATRISKIGDQNSAGR